MAESYIGEIRMLPYTFAPRNWAYCSGQTIPISQFSTVFAILGFTYGGDGIVSMGLPDMNACIPVSEGTGPGLFPRFRGQVSGSEHRVMTLENMPNHRHEITAAAASYTDTISDASTAAFLSRTRDRIRSYTKTPDVKNNVNMSPQSLTNAGATAEFPTNQPYLAVHFCICLIGEFPARN